MRQSIGRTLGFTLIELIVIILLLGILSAYAASRYSGTSGFSSVTTQSEVLASLRLTQNRAMQRTGLCNRWLVSNNQAQQVSPSVSAGACTTSLPSTLADSSFVDAAANDITLTLTNNDGSYFLDFDSLGRAAQCLTANCTVTLNNLQSGESRQVCINSEGYIYAC
ncbi:MULTISPECIES: prepilin-type N-terminal cleavage/methylation domain-containing protein [unclassified Vibrio]|uniref:prepilin-type N-terminal cleavage/methylation domain-containing protein n=1 Tax=unclassified Vibrio TaxID=2614977 RepID=UPI000B8E6222|nr:MULTISPECIES: prepilin-type N-terminal cleavage/methylation domain-containing protein [unclassified Vibrio]NAW91765.1 MSHA biogenesis protein MshC [Vibrio sp. V24_P1S3T111]OXX19590.1 MSHA biogenesis protein MshC [Vibrio sp. V05_P4A8T149]OXX24038.1 MSHA biogenesis protein MshC [Vibrio sp. V06_P1A73T115]OXX30421.1 MSHA biogenesis protein MshC [Vibrio sp. V04_P4A5T148]OXX32597.1 MSHA biogenesis protein MshC [Vibrio sp. V14_P6S14T42]